MLVSVGRLRAILWLTFVWVIANLGLSIAFVHIWGVPGVVAATVISYGPLLVAYTSTACRGFVFAVTAGGILWP